MGRKQIWVEVSDRLLEEIDKLIEEGYYNTRSEFLRVAIRTLLKEHGRLGS